MTGETSRDSSDSSNGDRFKVVFGVTEAELRQRGINPDEYARQNVRKVLKDKSIRRRVLSRGDESRRQYLQFLQAAYAFILVGFVSLVLYAIVRSHTIKWTIGLVAISCAVVAVLLFSAGAFVKTRANRADYKDVFGP